MPNAVAERLIRLWASPQGAPKGRAGRPESTGSASNARVRPQTVVDHRGQRDVDDLFPLVRIQTARFHGGVAEDDVAISVCEDELRLCGSDLRPGCGCQAERRRDGER
jgi:hypothetical protein